jgi:hypothetical protein
MEYEFEKKGIELEDGDYLKYLVLKEKEKNV